MCIYIQVYIIFYGKEKHNMYIHAAVHLFSLLHTTIKNFGKKIFFFGGVSHLVQGRKKVV